MIARQNTRPFADDSQADPVCSWCTCRIRSQGRRRQRLLAAPPHKRMHIQCMSTVAVICDFRDLLDADRIGCETIYEFENEGAGA